MRLLHYLPLAIIALLGGCATDGCPEPGVEVHETRIPVAQPCDAKVSAKPTYPDTDAAITAAPNVAERARLYAAGRKLRQAREDELQAAVDGCARPAAAKP